jgi:integrase
MKISMNLFRRGRKFYVRLNSRRRISLHTEDPKEAQRLFSELKKKWLAGKLAYLENRPPDKTLADFLAEYGEFSCRTKARNTWRADELALRKLIDALGPDTPLARITRKDIDTWLSSLAVANTSKNVYLRHLRAAFNQAAVWGYLKESPLKGVKEQRELAAPLRFLTQEEIARLLAAEPDPRFKLLWQFYLLTGVRRGEALQVQAKDIDWPRRLITVRDTKHKRPVYIRITPALEPILAALPQVGRLFPWGADFVSHHFHATAARAGLDFRLHDLRHTFASFLVMSGVDLFTVQKLLNHSEIKTTQRYAHLSPAYLEEALAKLKIKED